MSKKNRGEKEASRLRREVEILRTQLKAVRPEERREVEILRTQLRAVRPEESRAEKTEEHQARAQSQTNSGFRTTLITDYSYLKKDLLKTTVLSVLSFVSIFAIYFYQGKADQILKLLSPILRR